MLFTRYLSELTDPQSTLKTSRLAYLSGLRPAEVEEVSRVWETIPAARRQQIVRAMVDLAEDSVDMNFDEVLKLALRDSEPEVRRLSLSGLWESEDRELIDPIIELLRGDESEEVRAAAAEALGRFILLGEFERLRARDVARVPDALLATLDDEVETLLVQRRAVEAVSGLSGDPRVHAAIQRSYDSEDTQMRTSAIFAMGRNCDERWLPILLTELENEDPELRFEAVGACAQLEDERAVPKLIRLLGDPDRQIQLGAIDALGHIGGDMARQALRRCLQHPDEEVREAAVEALEELSFGGDPLSFGLGD